jgi:alpha-beta hydrolase superfamily lysophospholipase
MTIQELTLQSSNGETLWGQVWAPEEKARAVLVLVHGLGEHIQRYQYVAEKLNAKDIALVGFDQQGHGKSGGKRGVINSAEGLMEDITRAVNLTKEMYPGLPVFLYGHSMGALEVLYYGLNGPEIPTGIIATSPALDTASMSTAQRALVRLLKNILPELAVNNGLPIDGLSRDAASNQAYMEDPLVHPKASVRLAAFMMEAAEDVMARASDWDVPLYLAHGSADPICPVAGSDQFARRLGSKVTYKRWDGLYHETHNEPEKDVVIAAMLDWVEGQLTKI